MSVFQDSRGKIWVGTENGGVNVFDSNTGIFQRYLSNGADPFSVSSNNITAINEDVRGNIWIGTWGGGINFFDSNSKRFIKFHEDPNADANIVRNIYQTKNGDLFFGTHKGIKKLHYTKMCKLF